MIHIHTILFSCFCALKYSLKYKHIIKNRPIYYTYNKSRILSYITISLSVVKSLGTRTVNTHEFFSWLHTYTDTSGKSTYI